MSCILVNHKSAEYIKINYSNNNNNNLQNLKALKNKEYLFNLSSIELAKLLSIISVELGYWSGEIISIMDSVKFLISNFSEYSSDLKLYFEDEFEYIEILGFLNYQELISVRDGESNYTFSKVTNQQKSINFIINENSLNEFKNKGYNLKNISNETYLKLNQLDSYK